jgi:hypothetical protein
VARLCLVALLLLPGCFGLDENPQQELLRQRQTVEALARRLHEKMADGDSAAVRRLAANIKLRPRDAVVPGLIASLRSGDDEYNAVLIALLDNLDAAGWVPVPHRARVFTIEAGLNLIENGAVSARQADADVARIRSLCDNDRAALHAAWAEMLRSRPFSIGSGERAVDVTDTIHGLALLGLIRCHQDGSLTLRHGAIWQGLVVSPAIASQALIFTSGTMLKPTLHAALASNDATLRRAACIAVDLLRVRAVDFSAEPPHARLADAKVWVAKLPDRVDWRRVLLAELGAVTAAADKPDAPKAAKEQLDRAGVLLSVPDGHSPLRWLQGLPAAETRVALERAAGIDLLVRPPRN